MASSTNTSSGGGDENPDILDKPSMDLNTPVERTADTSVQVNKPEDALTDSSETTPKKLQKKKSSPKPSSGSSGGPKKGTATSKALTGVRDTSEYSRAPKRKGRIKWDVVATHFIEGIPGDDPEDADARRFPNLKELAEYHDISYQTVRGRSGKEKWKDRKQAHSLLVIRERQKARGVTNITRGLEFDEKAFKAGELGVTLITMRLSEIAQEIGRRKKIRDQALVDMEAGIAINKTDLYSAVNYKELEGLAGALDRFQGVGMRALGTDIQKHEISGPEGGEIQVAANLDIRAEITRDDPDRTAAILASLADAGMLPAGMIEEMIEEDEDILDAEELPEDGTE